MKKLLILTLVAVFALLAFSSCAWVDEGECAHEVIIKVPGKAATCTETGLTEGKRCDDCGATVVEQQTIPTLSHTLVTIPAVEGTCTKKGQTAGEKCSVCDTITKAPEETTIKHKEIHNSYIAPTCTNPGSTGGSFCELCKVSLQAAGPLDALGHIEATVPGKDATCTEEGYTEKVYCTREGCNEVITPSETIPVDLTKHPADKLMVVNGVAAICGSGVHGWSDGEKCSACGTVTKENEKIEPAAAHTMVEVSGAVAPNCATQTDGKTSHEECITCGYQIVSETIPYTHDYAGWVDAGNGTQTNTCKDCHYTATMVPGNPDEEKGEYDDWITN